MDLIDRRSFFSGEIDSSFSNFVMEDDLEKYRSISKYNLGESGNSPLSLSKICGIFGFDPSEFSASMMHLELSDSPNWGCHSLREVIASFHQNCPAENILVTTGTSEALLLLFRQIRPKKLALVTPAFQLLYEIPLSLGAKICPLPLHFTLEGVPTWHYQTWKNILETQKPDCILINTPHNPSGLVFDSQTHQMILDYCDETGAYLISDEHYRFLSDNWAENTWYRGNKKTFVTGSFIKCIGTPGLRIGWAVGDFEILQKMQNEKNYTTHTVNPLSEFIALKILSTFQNSGMNYFTSILNANKLKLDEFFSKSLSWVGQVPAGGLVSCLFPTFLSDELTLEQLYQRLLANGLFILPLSRMSAVGFKCSDAVKKPNDTMDINSGFRLGLGTSTKQLVEALILLDQFSKTL